eukprot:scaffold31531_cov66-Phaeocystis_antarctica.AAC.2
MRRPSALRRAAARQGSATDRGLSARPPTPRLLPCGPAAEHGPEEDLEACGAAHDRHPRAAPEEARVPRLVRRVHEPDHDHPARRREDHRRLVALLADVRQRAVEGYRADADECDVGVGGDEAQLVAVAQRDAHAPQRQHDG